MASLTSIACKLKEEFANKQTEIPCIIVGCTYSNNVFTQLLFKATCLERKEKREKPAAEGLKPRVSGCSRHNHCITSHHSSLSQFSFRTHWWYCKLQFHTSETTQLCGFTSNAIYYKCVSDIYYCMDFFLFSSFSPSRLSSIQ